MNVVILSPSFPYNFQNFYFHLGSLGGRVLGIDQKPYEELDYRLQECLTDYYRVNDLHNYNELEDACRYFISRHGPIDFIESHNEYWLETQASLATQFNIPCLNNSEIETVKRKSEMKKVFLAADLKPARGGLVPTLESALTLVQHIGYPVIVKPDRGVGANGCRKLNNDEEVIQFFNNKPNEEFIMEEFIDGVVCTFDGLVDKNGELLFYSSLMYESGVAEVVQKQIDTFYYTLRDIPKDLENIGKATLRAFNTQGCFFHFEYFRLKKDNSLMPIEINRRPPGGLTVDMYNFSSDINLYRLWAEMIMNNNPDLDYERKYHCIAANRRFKNTYVHSHEDVMERWNENIIHHYAVPAAFAPAMGDYCYFARAADLDDLMEIQAFIQSQRVLEPTGSTF